MNKLCVSVVATLALGAAMIVPAGASAAVGDPIVFVHGWSGNTGQWDDMKSRFTSAGWQSSQMTTVGYSLWTSNTTVAKKIKTAVANLSAANGGKKVTLISHSMGGISTRYYIKSLGGLNTIKTYVSLAGANHGTNTAYACMLLGDPGCIEMLPGSSYLKALNSGDETPGVINYATWWSQGDGVIIPAPSTILSGAQNTEVASLSHLAFLTDDGVGNQTVGYVKSK
jgi:triacylglycerol lipase